MRRYIRAVNAADLRRCKTVELANMSGTFHIAAFVCVNCQKRNPANCRIFAGSQARRCINGVEWTLGGKGSWTKSMK